MSTDPRLIRPPGNKDDGTPLHRAAYGGHTEIGLVVKRFIRGTGVWIMTSDNDADHPPRPVAEEDRILGRVIWFGPEKVVVVGG